MPLRPLMKSLAWIACTLLGVGLAAALCIALPPWSTRSVPIPDSFLAWLRSDHPEDLAKRLSDPLEVSLRLMYFGASDPIDTRGMTIKVDSDSRGMRIVTIDDKFIDDDSMSRSYSRVELTREGLLWVPIGHQAARQGRGVFGWTTGATQ